MQGLLEKKSVLFVAGLLAFFAVTRYYGFYEDAGRYLLQVVNYLYPERFADDVPFMFGNQDRYTIFSPIMAGVYKIVGVNHGALALTFIFQLSWCLGLIFLVNRWFDQFARVSWFLPVFVVCITTLTYRLYGCGSYFPIVDGILVARFAAEVFMLFAFACFFCKNRYISLILFGAGALFHPLMAGWGIPVWLFFHFRKLRVPILSCVFLFPLTAFLHLGSLDFLPKDWLERPLCYAPNAGDVISHALLLAFWLVMGRMVRSVQISRLAKCVCLVCLAGLFLQYVGIYMEHVFLIQVQPYRVQWFCIILAFPIMAIFCHEQLMRADIPAALRNIQISPKWAKIAVVVCLIVLFLIAALSNYIQLMLEHGAGDLDFAVSFVDLPSKLIPLQKTALCLLLAVSLMQRRFVYTLLFAYSLVNSFVTLLPIFATIFYLEPPLSKMLKRFLVSLTIVLTIAEILVALPISPMRGNFVGNAAFLGTIFVATFWFLWLRENNKPKQMFLPLVLALFAFLLWDACKWDARGEEMRKDERQMDAFLEKPLFPQIKERGRVLFVENYEFPLQSRFKFLTGTYADETIDIGGVFFEEQYKEARHRKNLLLNGDLALQNMDDYGDRIRALYKDKEALANRVEYLCRLNEIAHLVTDYGKMPFAKQDSAYFDVKKKYVYLYECQKRL